MLGPKGKELLLEGGKFELDPDGQVMKSPDMWTVHVSPPKIGSGGVLVFFSLDDSAQRRLRIRCSQCDNPCTHQGAALSLILEEKTPLGLAKPPEERMPLEALPEKALVARAIEERRERAKTEKMRMASEDPETPWTDYLVTSMESGKTYRVALRGWEPGESFCTCPDFRKNTIGTCKHILHSLEKIKRKFRVAERSKPYVSEEFYVYLRYGKNLELRLGIPAKPPRDTQDLIKPLVDRELSKPKHLRKLLATIQKLEAAGHPVTVYPDAEQHIDRLLHQIRLSKRMDKIRANAAKHPLRKKLIRAELRPYQLDGIAFAVGAGRAILADDMGLGKTIQGIGVAELLARESDVSRVLIICPASLKSQWLAEIDKFCDRSAQLVLGPAADRAQQYHEGAFFTICNYEQILRDYEHAEAVNWDLIILDEAQRIKNWEAKTARMIKSMRSKHALVLTGTPIENRIDDLYSILEFIDDRRLGPAFRFFNRHRVVDESGKVLAYKDLKSLRRQLKPVLLRRTRQSVLQDLPPRTTKIVRIAPTQEQLEIDSGQMTIVSTILRKKYLTEMDILRLQKALLLARRAADSTALVYRGEEGFSSKLDYLAELLERLRAEPDRKTVLFTEWTGMLDLIEEKLEGLDMKFARLDGSVPQKQRSKLVRRFSTDPECSVFLLTNAGSTGLNLQAANTVINVDLPWNPAVLEQRIGRAHRMGQKRPVNVYVLVTEETIEEKMLATLGAKQELALAVLDPDSTIDQVKLATALEDLKRRLEVLLGAKPEAPLDQSEKQREEVARLERERRKQLQAEKGGNLLDAAFAMFAESRKKPRTADTGMTTLFEQTLKECSEVDDRGRPTLTITLPDAEALKRLSAALAAASQDGGPSPRAEG